MSDSPLPDDLSAWPRNPYDLLGVRPGVDARDLRRAYTRLIRTYKPEQYPEHFRRIREAYEFVLRQVEFFRAVTPEPQKEAESVPAPREWTPAPEADLDDELRRLWDRVASCEEAAVYWRLRELLERHPGNTGICLRLYWLLFLLPELDSQRSPCDWLAVALRSTGLTGPPRELYRRALVDDPQEALSDRCRSLLELPARAGLVADLAEWRWQAACRLGRWPVVAADIDFLRARILREDEETWVRLLIAAVEQLVHLYDDGALRLGRQCWEEVNAHVHLQRRLTDSLDRLEIVLDVAAGCQALRRECAWPDEFLQMIPLSWTRPFPEVRPLLLRYLDRVARRPREALERFDRIHKQAPAVLTQFGYLLTMLQDTVPPLPEPDSAGLAELVRAYLDPEMLNWYATFRVRLLDFCVQEALPPETVAALVPWGPFAGQAAQDVPLRLVCWACRLFAA